MTKKKLPDCLECRLKKRLLAVAGTPTERRKGDTLYHIHHGIQYVVRVVRWSVTRSGSVFDEVVGQLCRICGFQANSKFKQLQLEALEELLGG